MPVYDYKCINCKNNFDFLHLGKEEKVECPKCKSEKVEKLISIPAPAKISNNYSSPQTSFSGSSGSCCGGGSCGIN